MNNTERKEIERCRDLAETIWQSDGGWNVSAEIADLKDSLARLLSVPPRNCDMFRTWDDAEAEYLRLVDNGKVEDGTWCEWLFAPAKVS